MRPETAEAQSGRYIFNSGRRVGQRKARDGVIPETLWICVCNRGGIGSMAGMLEMLEILDVMDVEDVALAISASLRSSVCALYQ